jgi:hypothetical protein|tara:strand:- start:271 stop:456 length:186 start_codon:yes stop_codon:yes gene_type:complete
MRIRVLAEETVYKECFVEVPQEVEKTQTGIYNWLSKNASDFKWVDYDFSFDPYTWEKEETI